MSHKLTDITLYYYFEDDFSQKFTLKQNVISDLYVQCLIGYKPPKTSRLSVELTDVEDRIIGYFGSILSIKAQFNESTFWVLTDKEQNQEILNTIHRIALLCAEEYNWEKCVFQNAYDKVIQLDFKYEIQGKKKFAPDRKHKATIQLEKNEINSTISVVFYDKLGSKIKSVELLKSFQNAMFYGKIINKYKWFNNNEFGLYTKDEELVIKASLVENKCEVIINPKKNSLEEIQGYLRSVTFQEISNQDEIVKWVNQ
jgi:hypothetical protein